MPTTYYRPDGFSHAYVQISDGDEETPAIVETRLFLANKASADASVSEKKWEGDDQEITKRSITGMTVQLDCDAVNASADKTIFNKTAITGTLAGGITNAFSFGGGGHVRGVSCGLRLEAVAIKVVDGVESNVKWCRWYPQGTLTPLKPGEFGTSAKLGVTSYSFTPVRTTKDIVGAAITGASADGEFYIEGELP
jgi:hypothetical protein